MKPILFSAPMIRAILDGRKTQTRRLIKPQPIQDADGHSWRYGKNHGSISTSPSLDPLYPLQNPYGAPGDQLWVRETWQYASCFESNQEGYAYAADYSDLKEVRELANVTWRPSIHMPRSASRITLNITGVRIQRLHDITRADAIAEGIDSFRPVPGDGPPETLYRDYLADQRLQTGQPVRKYPFKSPINSFDSLWQSIHGLDSFDSNPWVWVINFEKLPT